jgi:hypothetical protein
MRADLPLAPRRLPALRAQWRDDEVHGNADLFAEAASTSLKTGSKCSFTIVRFFAGFRLVSIRLIE